MKTIRITKSDLDADNKYKKGHIGTYDNYEDAHVEIDECLGYVVFEKGIYVKGSVVARAGEGIEAGWGIDGWFGYRISLLMDQNETLNHY